MEIPDSCEDLSCQASAIYISRDKVKEIPLLDRCIVPELKALWAQGIETICSCCGHGNDERSYIRVPAEEAGKMLALGYEPYEMHACEIWPGAVAFRAKHTAEERAKPKPPEKDPEVVRAMWRMLKTKRSE